MKNYRITFTLSATEIIGEGEATREGRTVYAHEDTVEVRIGSDLRRDLHTMMTGLLDSERGKLGELQILRLVNSSTQGVRGMN